MNIDLSLIDQVENQGERQARKTTKFAPRAKQRLPKLNDGVQKIQQIKDISQLALPSAASPSDRQAGQHANSSDPTDLQQANVARLPEDEAGNDVEATEQDGQPVEGDNASKRKADLDLGAGLPLRLRKKLKSASALEGPSQEHLAMVPVDPDKMEIDNEDQIKPKGKKLAGKVAQSCDAITNIKRKVDIEAEANKELDPGQDSIHKFVKRAMAQEKMRLAQAKRKREEVAAEEQDEDEQLAIQAPPEKGLTLAPQLELVDGKLVPKAQSLTVQAQAEPTFRRVREYTNVVNNASYTNRAPSDRWSPEETEAFFNAIRCFGANFELISKLFPGRPRKSLANKWRRENKQNPDRVEAAYKGGGSLEGLEKVVEALQSGESAEGDFDGFGLQATEIFELPSAQTGAIIPLDSSGPGPSKRRSKKPKISSLQDSPLGVEDGSPSGTGRDYETSQRGQRKSRGRGRGRGKKSSQAKDSGNLDHLGTADKEGAEGLLQFSASMGEQMTESKARNHGVKSRGRGRGRGRGRSQKGIDRKSIIANEKIDSTEGLAEEQVASPLGSPRKSSRAVPIHNYAE